MIIFRIMTNYNKMSNLKVYLQTKILILYANLMVDIKNKLAFLVFVLKITKVKLCMSSLVELILLLTTRPSILLLLNCYNILIHVSIIKILKYWYKAIFNWIYVSLKVNINVIVKNCLIYIGKLRIFCNTFLIYILNMYQECITNMRTNYVMNKLNNI